VDIRDRGDDIARMRRPPHKPGKPIAGPSQRQLRAGELVRHALVEVLREEEVQDEALAGVSVTVGEVSLSPDLRHAVAYVQPLGGEHAPEVVAALNKHSRFLRGALGRRIDLKFTPDLRFMHDESFEKARRMDQLFANEVVRRDLDKPDVPEDPPEGGADGEA
jgi:ribosome-binding factor A